MGEATAREIAKRGHTVVATMRNPADFAVFKDAEGTFDFERMDINDADNVKAALGSVEARHGRIDVLINNAGYGVWGAVEDVSEEELAAQFNTNVVGTLRTCKAVLPGMRERKGGRILNVVSFVRSPMPWMGAYFASKAAVWHLTACMAYEVAQFGVEVKMVEPGGYRTDWQTDSLWVAERSRNGDSPYGTQTQDSWQAVMGDRSGWPGPDHFGQGMADLVDTPEIPFWNVVAGEGFDAMLEALPKMTFEEQGDVWRESFPGYVPSAG